MRSVISSARGAPALSWASAAALLPQEKVPQDLGHLRPFLQRQEVVGIRNDPQLAAGIFLVKAFGRGQRLELILLAPEQ